MRLSPRNSSSHRRLSGCLRFASIATTRGLCGGSLLIAVLASTTAFAQTLEHHSLEKPLTRLRPIGASSAVDHYEQGNALPESNPETTHQVVTAEWESTPRAAAAVAQRQTGSGTRYAAMMQFQLPDGSAVPTTAPPIAPTDASAIAPPSLSGSPAPPVNAYPQGTVAPPASGTVLGPSVMGPSTSPIAPPDSQGPPTTSAPAVLSPMVTPPRGLPMNQGPVTTMPMTVAPPRGDLLPVAPPQLNDQYATIDNCSCISPPSGYVAAFPWPRPASQNSYPVAPAPAYIATPAPVAVSAPIAAPAVISDASTMPKGSGVPRHSLVSFGQDRNPIVVGQGIVGQPVAYVPGQPVRNCIRYIFP